MPKEYFDLHVHAVVKQFLTKYEEQVPTSRRNAELKREVSLSRDFMRFVDDAVLHLLRSQSSFDQLIEGGLSIGVGSIAPLELGYASSKGFFGKLLRSKWTAPLEQKYFRKIAAGEISYLNLFLRELDLYDRLEGDCLNFISRKNNSQNDQSKPGMVFSIEGGHSLSCFKVGQSSTRDPMKGFDLENPLFKNLKFEKLGKPATNLRVLFEAMWSRGMDILYLTLTHLTHIGEQYLATHAFGLKLIKHPAFYPSGSGISDMGKEVISAAYKMKQGNKNTPILIDVKHMSLRSRLDFYQYRRESGFDQKFPIIASHMGVTGYNIDEWKDALVKDKCEFHYDQGTRTIKTLTLRKIAGKWGAINNEFTFNPWTINLMDEDIVEILESNGLIGLNLDVRILGFQSLIGPGSKDTEEFISTAEFTALFPEVDILSLARTSEQELMREEESWLVPKKEDRHPLCLCFNIIHIHCIGKLKTGIERPLSQVCIGTDFDGLIEPVKVCREFSAMHNLEFNLLKWLPIAAEAYQEQNGGPNYLYADFQREETLSDIVRDILNRNGVNFIEKWLVNKF